MKQRRWFERVFELGLEITAWPEVVERIRGTPARIEEKVAAFDADFLVRTLGDSWSIQENIGHLLDLEPLWAGRLEDVIAGRQELRPADLTNRATHEAGHNARAVSDLTASFRTARSALITSLEALDLQQVRRTALHPRLQQPMTVVDLFFFVAEHDDHHLARMTEIARRLS